jgi:hypothetical protein
LISCAHGWACQTRGIVSPDHTACLARRDIHTRLTLAFATAPPHGIGRASWRRLLAGSWHKPKAWNAQGGRAGTEVGHGAWQTLTLMASGAASPMTFVSCLIPILPAGACPSCRAHGHTSARRLLRSTWDAPGERRGMRARPSHVSHAGARSMPRPPCRAVPPSPLRPSPLALVSLLCFGAFLTAPSSLPILVL